MIIHRQNLKKLVISGFGVRKVFPPEIIGILLVLKQILKLLEINKITILKFIKIMSKSEFQKNFQEIRCNNILRQMQELFNRKNMMILLKNSLNILKKIQMRNKAIRYKKLKRNTKKHQKINSMKMILTMIQNLTMKGNFILMEK